MWNKEFRCWAIFCQLFNKWILFEVLANTYVVTVDTKVQRHNIGNIILNPLLSMFVSTKHDNII